MLLYWRSNEKLDAEYSQQVQIMGRLATQDFQSSFTNNIVSLKNLRDRIVESQGSYFEYWERDAQRLVAQQKAFKFIEFINPKGVITSIVPNEGNEAAIGLDITQLSYRYPEWKKHSAKNTVNITSWLPLTQTGQAFLVDVPIYFNGKFHGTLTAGMDFTEAFNAISHNIRDHSINLADSQGNLFYQFNPVEEESIKSSRIFNSHIVVDSIDNERWSFQFLYNDGAEYSERILVIKSALVFGIVLSALSSMLVLLFLKSNYQTKRLQEANEFLRELNEQLEQERDRAAKASEAKTQFLSNMSHEIRTPLHAILGVIELAEDSGEYPRDYQDIDILKNASTSLLSLVNDILDIDRIEAGKIEFLETPFCPSQLLQSIVEGYQLEARKKGLTLELIVDHPNNHWVVGDKAKTFQIFNNIISNAIKFTDQGGVTISYWETLTDGYLKFTCAFEDTGIGITQGQKTEIFNRFTQVGDVIKKRHKGSGLGLSIVKGLIDFLGGTIGVESEVGKGTTFTVSLTFPLVEETKEVTSPIPDLVGAKALIIDDNRLNSLILGRMLEKSKIEVSIATSGKEGKELIDDQSFQFIFLDIHMPETNGFEVAKFIRESDPEVFIIGFSADVTKDTIERGKKAGMDDYLIKPIDKYKLFSILEKLQETVQ
jgi:signal transduction histidine kinase/CheY-like chemotaxis protein